MITLDQRYIDREPIDQKRRAIREKFYFADSADGAILRNRVVHIDGSGDLLEGTIGSQTVIGVNSEADSKANGDGILVGFGKVNLVTASPVAGGAALKCADNGRVTQLVTAAVAGTVIKTSATGSAFTNQPADDGVEVVSSSASDITQTVTVIGTTQATDTVVVEELALDGTTAVSTVKADWGVILAVKLDAACVGTITFREASANAAITTIAPAALQSGVVEVAVASQGAFGVIPAVKGSVDTTSALGLQIVGTDGVVAYDSQALTAGTAVAANTAALLVTEVYKGNIEADETVTVAVGAEEDENNKIGRSFEAATAADTTIEGYISL